MKCNFPLFAATVAVVWTASDARAEISIDNTHPLAFGSFAAGSGGTVTVSTSDVRSSSGDITLIPSSEGQAAKFTVSGDPDSTYSIELPTSDVKLLGAVGEMVVNDFVSAPAGAEGQLSSGGSQVLSVGATLRVGSGQPPGEYSGNFMIMVSYN